MVLCNRFSIWVFCVVIIKKNYLNLFNFQISSAVSKKLMKIKKNIIMITMIMITKSYIQVFREQKDEFTMDFLFV